MIVGTAGHIDHGKTALVRALTGVDTDRLKEEKARGITVDLGFAYLPRPDGTTIGFVDVPGHERFVHTMLAGAGGIDFALLLVAADDGVMPQTREHAAILDLLGIRRGLVVLSKADKADTTRREAVTAEIRTLLTRTSLATAPILPVSVHTGEGLDTLKARLDEAAAATATAIETGRFRLAVDRSFTLPGAGTVVTGTVLSGTVAPGDSVLASPSGLPARVRGIQSGNRPTERGRAGQRLALNLAGESVTKDAITRGDAVLDPALHAPTARIDATLRVLPGEPAPVGTWFPARFHLGPAETGCRVVPLGDPIAPGGEGPVQLVLDTPLAATVGDRFVLRNVSAQRTIGGGTLLDLRAPPRKRRTPERLALLAAAAETDPARAFARLLDLPPFTIDLNAFARDRALAAEQAATLAADAVVLHAGRERLALAADRWAAFTAAVADTLAAFHADNPDVQGLGRETLRLGTEPRLPSPFFRAALDRLAREGALVAEGTFLRLPGHEVRLDEADEALFTRAAPLLGADARFRPPRVRDLATEFAVPEAEVRRVLKACTRLGRIDQVAHDHFFLRSTVAEMVELARDVAHLAPNGAFTAAAFRDRMDNGRKVAIQILDFLDRLGITLRRGDLRRINPHRADMFAPAWPEAAIDGRASSPVGRPDFKSGWGSEPVPGGFDSHSLPPSRDDP